MECIWDASLLKYGGQLPAELLQIIQAGSHEQYLQAITQTTLDARYTYILLAHCENLFAEVCGSLRTYGSFASTIATLGRIIPFAPHLVPYATQILVREHHILNTSNDETEDLMYLLGLFRLLRYDHRIFRKYVRAHEFTSILGICSRSTTYLLIRILQICLHGADHWFETTFRQYLGDDTVDGDITGLWDETTIDYRFLTLWEETRFEAVYKLMSHVKQSIPQVSSSLTRVIPCQYFDQSTALVGGVLFPSSITSTTSSKPKIELVDSETTVVNLNAIAKALKLADPILMSGIAGSGKSLLVRHVARSLGKLDQLVTLHLNEQSDAKMLLGIYTTGEIPGSFVWKAGVLTTAVQEGRWVMIEDLDRAPSEVIGTLLPLLEKRELLIPNRKDTIHAAEGFRIFATVRTAVNHRGEETRPLTHMLGYRHWNVVSVHMPSMAEHALIAQSLYPTLEKLLPQFSAVYERLTALKQQSALMTQGKTGVARGFNPRDLLKWCGRVHSLLRNRETFTSSDMDAIFLEAVDCFIGSLPDDLAHSDLAAVIAEQLRIDPQRRDHLLRAREVQYDVHGTRIKIGRYSLHKSRHGKVVTGSFSTNPHTSRMLERVAAAVMNREPLLLVGETGVGKTTAVQHLASHLGKKLVPFNLSQQSEAGDLLGGFKPVNVRTMIVPIKDDFDELFAESFSASKNKQFIELLGKQIAKSNWRAVCKLWRQALSMVDQQRPSSPRSEGEAPSKKRKVDTKRAIDFARWDTFAESVEDIERKLANGNEAFAFTFVEGNIVKAVRNGDWVLLDEINLASSDTLESIADLLDPTFPSLVLTEAGGVERINAHDEFRVFAAMNPATDVGKKDLPPGIRSRFTELYVEGPDKDIKSLLSIVRAYLRQESSADSAVASDVSVLYQKIIALAADNKLVDGGGQKPHFSLRTLTRTLSYAKQIQHMCSLRRALYEGFQMSFLTFLDAESAQLVQPLIEQQMFGKKSNIRSELQKVLRKPSDGRSYIQGYPGSKHWLRTGAHEPQEQPYYIITPFVERNLENLVRATSTRQFPVLIQGPTSSGKTSMIEFLAKRTGHIFTRINNHEHTDLQEYLGTYVSSTDGRLQFQEGVLVKALREGHWIVLDELNLAPTDVLEALNRLLDDNRELLVPETQEVIRPHSDFMLFATQNPAGLYGGRKTLSRAFRNRFLELHFDDIPVNELEEILHRRTQLPESRCKRIVNVYKELSVLRQENRLFEQKSFATLRDLFRWALRPNDNIEQLAANGYMLLCERIRKPEERVALKSILERVMSEKGPRVKIDEGALYSDSCNEIQQYQRISNSHHVVWTKAMRRLYVLVSRAIQNAEPVLLVGETGCGKTTVCQMLAQALSKELHTVNAHQNTETGDLIGSQRPVRNRSVIEATLRRNILASPLLQTLDKGDALAIDMLLDTYDQAFAKLDKEKRMVYQQSTAHHEVQGLRTKFRALFEWSDGSLVHAMRNGDFFLLDEISLADDSVLERINSVLESHRTILLAEKGSLDSFVTAAPGFQFFATMNPGGDYGKRELSPALRNRFTEIWVPSLSDMDDVLQIVRSKLVESAQPCAEAMVAFASWFKTRFDTSACSSVSIRDILAWVEFVNAFAKFDVLSAVVHGAALVYIDTLGANPAGLITLVSNDLDQERRACLDELGRLKLDAYAIYHQASDVTNNATSFGIGAFCVPKAQATASSDVSFTFDPPTTRSNAMRVLRALQLTKPVMLEGSPGVGKTALVIAIASVVGIPLTRINLSDQTDLLDLFGSDAPVEGAQTGTFVWRDAPFLRSMKNGEWVLLDEMNLASQSVLEGLNACLDHRGEVFIPELGQTFVRHPNFRLFAAQNPHHQGGGRKGLPASFVNRFTVVYADSFQSEDLMLICGRTFPGLDNTVISKAVEFVSMLNQAITVRRVFGSTGGPWEFNLRDIVRWLTLASSGRDLLKAGTSHDFIELLFTLRFRTGHDRSCVESMFASVFDDTIPTSDTICNISARTLQVGLALLPRNELHSQARNMEGEVRSSAALHSRVLQSVMICVQKSWPVILSGPSGVGKTTLIQKLAGSVGADVITLAMNSETDALDLIGGYEQFDPYRQMSDALSKLRFQCNSLSKLGIGEGSQTSASGLLQRLEELETDPTSPTRLANLAQSIPAQAKATVFPHLRSLQQMVQTIDKAKFEWVDGPLIKALQRGDWLILDNANLCSASVLDRLNSLLEPNGALVINENNTEDGSPRIVKQHPEFRVFLTLDPRLGELSRAMRNRGVELFLTPNNLKAASSTDGLHCESAIARFRSLRVAASAEPDHREQTLSTAFDHLALSDQVLLPRMLRQLGARLFRENLHDLHDSNAQHQQMPEIQVPVGALYEQISSYMQVPADFARVQTLHPLNNQPLVQISPQAFSQALAIAAQYDLQFYCKRIINYLNSIKADRKLVDSLARSWRSIRQELRLHSSKALSGPLDVVERLLRTLYEGLRQAGVESGEGRVNAKPIITTLLSYCWTFLRALSSGSFDMAMMTACSQVGQTLYIEVSSRISPALFPPLNQFDKILSELDLKSTNSMGQAYTTLWRALRPNMPASIQQLEASIKFEAAIERFDQAVSSFKLPISQILELRSAFQRALVLGYTAGSDLDDLSDRTIASMHTTGTDAETETLIQTGPHFASSFELLCQHFAMLELETDCLSSSELASLEVLALRRTLDGMRLHQGLSRNSPHQVFRLLSSSLPRRDANSEHGSVLANIVNNLGTVDQVSLDNLSLFEDETTILGQLISLKAPMVEFDNLTSLDFGLESLLRVVLQSLAEAPSAAGLANSASQILLELDEGITRDTAVLQNIRMPRFQFVMLYLNERTLRDARRAATAWTCFATACLELFIPDHAFDPVQEANIQRAVFQNTKDDMHSRLLALRAFRENWIGEQNSLRARLLEQDIVALGPGPAAVDIHRPPVSQLAQLHSEFQAVRRVVQPLRSVGTSDDECFLDPTSWSNLRTLRRRLKEQYRAYADLTTPVIGFIDCLLIGRHLSARADHERASRLDSVSTAMITPMAKAGAEDWLSDKRFLQVHQRCRSKEEQLYWLSALAVRSRVISLLKVSPYLRPEIENTFRAFYEGWKIGLTRDQKLAAAKSSLYKYRGGDDDEDETTQEELDELFPTYESVSEPRADTVKEGIDAQMLAPRIAKLYHAIYASDTSISATFTDLLQQWAETNATQPSQAKEPGLPAILFALQKLIDSLSKASSSSHNQNIYRNANIEQSRSLVRLVRRVQARFNDIHIAWPDHATPVEVLRSCNQILALRHAEPLARFLPAVEKLHTNINEWQKVASSEFSASTLLEETIDTIVRWRQLELSTWAGMFDSEDEQCQTNAASWWYIAYETIIRAAEETSQHSEELITFSRQLVEILGGFLANSGLGEYGVRLDLLADFEAALAVRSHDEPRFSVVREALASLISFYSRFKPVVSDQLAKKRADLERDIKNVIQLASWKDRNIETLRQSAKTSHKKLFRTVRKYRQLLSQPVSPVLQAEFSYVQHELLESQSTPNVSEPFMDKAVPVSTHLKIWQDTPLSLRDPLAVARELETKFRSVRASSTAEKRIKKFLIELDGEMNELRKATPSVAKEENKTIVQHLKARKRRLLADVLRDLRLMGFQSNIGEDVLSQQRSLHHVLAQTPPLSLRGQVGNAAMADQEFHRVLYIMSSVRDSAVKYSEDLTPAEVARSKILLESMLRVSLEQRHSLSEHLAGLKLLKSGLEQYSMLTSSVTANIRDLHHDSAEILKVKLGSFLQFLQSSFECVEAQSSLCSPDKTDKSHDVDSLNEIRHELMDINNALAMQKPMPRGVSNAAYDKLMNRFAEALASVKDQVAIILQAHPELKPILSHLLRWAVHLSQPHHPPQSDSGLVVASASWVERLTKLLVQVQRFELTFTSVPSNGPPVKAWLIEQQNRLNSAIHDLQIHAVSHELLDLLDQLHCVQFGRDVDLSHVVAVCSDLQPVLTAYVAGVEQLINDMSSLHAAINKMAHRLAVSFVQLASQGFCTPPEKAPEDDKQSGQVESGTGLGDGEGGEDISKDIKDDEDLSELAQDAKSGEKDEETQAEKDAVDMADEDLAGEFDESPGSEGEDENEGEDGQSDAEIDEETGHVDDSDATAVDEKTWNDGKAEDADKEADSGKGTRDEDVSAATEDAKESGEDGPEEGEQEIEAGAEADQEVERQQPEQADAHLEEEQNLDLPDDINMDGDKQDMSDISDDGSEFADTGSDAGGRDADVADPDKLDTEMGEEDPGDQVEETGEATAAEEEDEQPPMDDEDTGSDVAMLERPDTENRETEGLEAADAGQGHEKDDKAQANGALSAAEQLDNENDADQPSAQPGTAQGSNRAQQEASSGQAEPGNQDKETQPFKQLGDVLKQWYDQHRNIEAAQEIEDQELQSHEQAGLDDARFEHTEDAAAEMQAIGAASAEQSRALDDQNAVPIEQTEPDTAQEVEDTAESLTNEPDEDDTEGAGALSKGTESSAQLKKTVIGTPTDIEMEGDGHFEASDDENDVDDVDEQLTNTHLDQSRPEMLPIEAARQAWAEHESRTRNMAVVLTEHLRLILHPTQATKMRGDFRTGKRLNIKKIIPYIASSYKRDKIWMRRSIPSKRAYQILLCIDDSESMNESRRRALAFDTLALVSKSLAMLEAGELCIVGFGETARVNHDFGTPFTSDAGAEVFRHFSFAQKRTDVRSLLQTSLGLFRAARLKAAGSAADLWQLQLVISDGLCEDHAEIRRLVRQAHEERIMVVFIVVDATAAQDTAAVADAGGPKQSIVDLQRAEFSKDGSGEPQIRMVKYLDTFPFRYYLIVRDVQDLPGVLAGALRQWFSEVMETGG